MFVERKLQLYWPILLKLIKSSAAYRLQRSLENSCNFSVHTVATILADQLKTRGKKAERTNSEKIYVLHAVCNMPVRIIVKKCYFYCANYKLQIKSLG
jgi:hypothetical protein